MTVAFVTAIFNIHPSRSNEIWERFSALTNKIHIHIVCSPEDKEKIPLNATPYFIEFNALKTFETLAQFNSLPRLRSVDKDTKEYMILMNAKAEIIQRVQKEVNATHYIWIDAGISKIFKDPSAVFNKILSTAHTLKSDKILIPGCWPYKESNPSILTEKIHWRFCGGFFIVPHQYVDLLASEVLAGAYALGVDTSCLTWEVNTWCFIESRLPIQWEKGDHNETIIDGLINYKIT